MRRSATSCYTNQVSYGYFYPFLQRRWNDLVFGMAINLGHSFRVEYEKFWSGHGRNDRTASDGFASATFLHLVVLASSSATVY